jgi:hypothetical protein
VGTFGICRYIIVTVDGQTSNRRQYCYDADKGELTGLPVGIQQITEAKNITYTIGISLVPDNDIEIHLQAVSTSVNYNCFITPSMITFPASSPITTTETIHISTQGNVIDEGTDAITYACQVKHTVTSADPQYSTHPVSIVDMNVINDDQADVKLWTINSETNAYDYDVKFVGPLSTPEGDSIAYGVRLDTEPRFPVTIYPNITLNYADNIVIHPILHAKPSILVFDKTNWSTIQRLELISSEDQVDNNNERFQILHQVITKDTVLYEKSTQRPIMTILDVVDDDTAAIVLENTNILPLNEGGNNNNFIIDRFATKPVANVT